MVVLSPFILACSGAQNSAETPADGSGTSTEAPLDEVNQPGLVKSTPSESSDSGGLNKEQREQMEVVLKRGASAAATCSESVPDGKGGEGELKVLFDGQKGRITDVTVGAPWAGTSMEACVKRSFVNQIIVPFEGDPLEVPYTIKIPERKSPIAADPNAKDPKKPGKKP
ncbi:MAG: hypothetical protein U0441_27425 [Polyangiaceae bacterium]